MSTVDQSRYAASIPASTRVLVQNGSADTTYSADAMRAWQNVVAGTKAARMYDGAGHTLNAAADAERLAFLRESWRRTP
jgi:surfactin synthase thioesterase subunit